MLYVNFCYVYLIQTLILTNPNISTGYYVYAYLRKNGIPYYIGKGKNYRAYKKTGHFVDLPLNKSEIVFLKTNINETEAFFLEAKYIKLFGRIDINTGVLLNKTSGGQGSSGRPSQFKGKTYIEIYGEKRAKEIMRKKIPNLKGKCGKSKPCKYKGKTYIEIYGEKRAKEIISSQSKRFLVVSPLGDTHDILNLFNFCKLNNLDNNSMHKVATGKHRHWHYWRCWRWEDRPEIIENQFNFVEICKIERSNTAKKNIAERNATQHKWDYKFTNINGTIINGKSVKAFCKSHNVSSKQMLQVAKGARESFKGWTCKRTSIINN